MIVGLERFEVAVDGGVMAGWLRPADGTPDQTVLLLHGINGIADEWEPLARALPAHTRVVAFDLPAHGGSRSTGDFELDSCAQSVATGLETLKLGPVHVVGSSFGGGVALALAARATGQVRTVVTIGTGPGGETELFAVLAAAVRANGAAAFFAETIRRYSYPAGTADDVIDRAVERASSRSDEEAIAILETGFSTSLESVAAATTVPRLVIGGTEDLTSPPETVTALATAAGTAATIVPGFGHLPHLEQPDALAALLTDWWRQPTSSPLTRQGNG